MQKFHKLSYGYRQGFPKLVKIYDYSDHFSRELFCIRIIFSCPKGSSIGEEVTGARGGAAVLRKSREAKFRSFSRSGKVGQGKHVRLGIGCTPELRNTSVPAALHMYSSYSSSYSSSEVKISGSMAHMDSKFLPLINDEPWTSKTNQPTNQPPTNQPIFQLFQHFSTFSIFLDIFLLFRHFSTFATIFEFFSTFLNFFDIFQLFPTFFQNFLTFSTVSTFFNFFNIFQLF